MATTAAAAAAMRFSGKRALVTGAGRGIGREIVRALAREGADVGAVARTLDDLETLAVSCRKDFGRDCVQPLIADAANAPALRDALESEAGDLDLLVNNAGVARTAPLLKAKVQDLDETMVRVPRGRIRFPEHPDTLRPPCPTFLPFPPSASLRPAGQY